MKKKTLPRLPPIPQKKYFKIGEASELIGVPDHMLRYWEAEIPQFCALRRGTHRRYRPEDIKLGRLIRELKYGRGLTTEGIKNALTEYRRRGEKLTIEESDTVEVAPHSVPKELLKPEDIEFLEGMVKSLKEINDFLRNK